MQQRANQTSPNCVAEAKKSQTRLKMVCLAFVAEFAEVDGKEASSAVEEWEPYSEVDFKRIAGENARCTP